MTRPGALLLFSLLGVFGADWPHLRGPNYNAVATETDLAEQWPAAGPPVLWTRNLGQGYSALVIANGTAYTQYQTLLGQVVVALDAQTGSVCWDTAIGPAWQSTGGWPGPYATPTVADNSVFYATPQGVVGRLDAHTGRLIWHRNVVAEFAGTGCEFGYAATPLVEAERVIVPVGGPGAALVALAVADGRTLWQAGDDPASYTPAFPITYAGRQCVVGYLRNTLAIHDLATGAVVFRETISTQYDEHAAWPLWADGRLWVSAPFRAGSRQWRWEAGQWQTAWHSRRLANDVCSSVLVAGHVYGADLLQAQASAHQASRAKFTCQDWHTGQVRWSTERLRHAALVAAGTQLFALTDTGELVLMAANPTEYVERGRVQLLTGVCWTPPTLADKRLYVRDHTRAVCLAVGRPETLSAAEQARAVPAAQMAAGQVWTWSHWLGAEPEFPNDAPTLGEHVRWLGLQLLLVFSLVRWTKPHVFVSGLALLACVAGPLLSWLTGQLWFTWPLLPWVGLWATLHAGQQAPKWQARLVGLLWLAVCGLYFAACRAVGLYLLWGFLVGLLPAFPFLVLAVRWPRFRLLWLILALLAYHAGAAGVIAW